MPDILVFIEQDCNEKYRVFDQMNYRVSWR